MSRRRDPFAALAPLYERFAGASDTTALRALLGQPTEGWLADVGGGTGRVAVALRDLARQVVVVDPSRAMLSRAREKASLHLVRAVTEALPFPDGSLARIVVVDAFHHFADQDGSVRELWRVLAPGGRLVVEEPDARRLPARLIALGERILGFDSHFREPARIAAAFAALGATVRVESSSGLAAWIVVEKAARS